VKRIVALAAIALAASCGSMAKSRQNVDFVNLRFDMPGGWSHADHVFKGVATSIWTPEDNETSKESITVIRTELAPVMEHASEAQLLALLEGAQKFRGAKVGAAAATTTASGFRGARVEVDYVPPGLRDKYHRVHVVLVDGRSLVHVMYTAKIPDPQLTALNTVLGTIRQGEG
jgi:hypothetical protein